MSRVWVPRSGFREPPKVMFSIGFPWARASRRFLWGFGQVRVQVLAFQDLEITELSKNRTRGRLQRGRSRFSKKTLWWASRLVLLLFSFSVFPSFLSRHPQRFFLGALNTTGTFGRRHVREVDGEGLVFNQCGGFCERAIGFFRSF